MLLKFQTKQEFMDYFSEENHTLHKGFVSTHRYHGTLPESYPVLLQSGPIRLLDTVTFRKVDVSVTKEDELRRLVLQAESDYHRLEQEDTMQMREVLR